MHPGDGRVLGILFANAARDHGGDRHAEADRDGEDEAEQRFGEADGSDGVCAETADEENVNHSE